MKDPLFENTTKAFRKKTEEITMLKREVKMLRDLLSNKEEKPKPTVNKTIDDFNGLDFCKEFQKLYKAHYGVGFNITNFGTASTSMNKVIEAFRAEGQTNTDVLEFLKWGVKRKTHTNGYMTIGYLNVIIQDYRMETLAKPVEESIEVQVDPEKLKNITANRSRGLS